MKKTIISLALLALASAASAQVYVNGAVGAANTGINCEEFDSCDKSDTGFKANIGYKLTPNFAVEAGYMSLGKAKASIGDVLSASVGAQGLTVGVAGFVPFTNELTGTARAGVFFQRTKLSINFLGESASESESNTTPYVGLGVSYALTKEVSLQGGIDFTKVKFDGESVNARLLSVGLGYQF